MKRAGKYWVPDEEEIQLEALEKGGWQIDHLEAALRHVKKFDLAVDGGAHVGSWTLAMLMKFDAVHAFEPSPATFTCLQRNVEEWDDGHLSPLVPSIALHNFGLGDVARRASMREDGKYSNGGNTGGRYLVEEADGPVEVRALDTLHLRCCDFLKLDVEGFELFALKGAARTIMDFRPVIQIEVKHRMAARYGLGADAAGTFLKQLGMVFLERVGCDEIYGWKK